MNNSVPDWARRRFGSDAEAVQDAVWGALEETAEGMLDVQAVSRNRRGFAPGGERMVDQFDLLVERILDLGLEGTEVVKTGTWYKLALVGEALFYPVHIDSPDENIDQWPRKVSNLVKEIFAATDSASRRWIADPLPGDEALLPLRPSLEEVASRSPRPRLVLVAYEMDRSGLKRAWWGEVEMSDDSGTLEWLTEQSPLAAPVTPHLMSLGATSTEDDRFDSGDLPEVPMSGRSPAERNLGVTPLTEAADVADHDTAESDED
ncbi:hypothetical protein [Streptomyces sp. A0592]|uniref:hypothetical protein n=1 Tax=Streptomyces sp. A0592 TaxID=2563099 RepID=UPI00109E3C9D|nr:hypothetical protein [Streptomyces sp. A0592]THA81392.1 hypothetical protein E6U81_25155 [Streptomyces sp. A0592]